MNQTESAAARLLTALSRLEKVVEVHLDSHQRKSKLLNQASEAIDAHLSELSEMVRGQE